jgi:hypothetical protein
MQLIRVHVLLVLSVFAACATREVLETKSAAPPPGIDFSGYWQLSADSPADRDRINAAIGQAAGGDFIPLPPERGRNPPPPTRSSSRKSGGGLVRVFLESGQNLKVTQTADGIFISYDRSVVREFRFGENRTVSVGEIVAQRVSGWVGERYVAETLDRNGMKLTEQLYLSSDRQRLHRHISLRKADQSEVTLQQTFSWDGSLSRKDGEEPARDPAGN